MLGIHYLQSSPTTYVMRYKNGQLVESGLGLSMLYFGPSSTIVHVSQAMQDLEFSFLLPTLDFQEVTIEGSLSYQVISPDRLTSQFDYSIDSHGQYRSDGPKSLKARLERLLRSQTLAFTRDQPLLEMLDASNSLEHHLLESSSLLSAASSLGLEFTGLIIDGICPSEEVAAALRAETQQRFLRNADEAAHERRRLASELEREQLATELELEKQRAELGEQRIANEQKSESAKIELLKQTMDALSEVDWRTVVASRGPLNHKQMMAISISDLAENARKIGQLDLSSELLNRLANDE